MATRKNCAVSIDAERDFSRVSPPGSSSTSIFCPRCSESASGRTAQAESSCSRKAYSRSIFFSVASEGCSEEGARTRIDGSPRSLECSARYRTNSSSLRRGSRTYCDRFTPPPSAFLPEMSAQLVPRWPRLQSHSQGGRTDRTHTPEEYFLRDVARFRRCRHAV